MNRTCHTLALVAAILSLALWFFGGFNPGRTVLHAELRYTNAVTGQVEVERQTVFRPGLDFLGACLAGAAICWALGQRGRRPPPPQTEPV